MGLLKSTAQEAIALADGLERGAEAINKLTEANGRLVGSMPSAGVSMGEREIAGAGGAFTKDEGSFGFTGPGSTAPSAAGGITGGVGMLGPVRQRSPGPNATISDVSTERTRTGEPWDNDRYREVLGKLGLPADEPHLRAVHQLFTSGQVPIQRQEVESLAAEWAPRVAEIRGRRGTSQGINSGMSSGEGGGEGGGARTGAGGGPAPIAVAGENPGASTSPGTGSPQPPPPPGGGGRAPDTDRGDGDKVTRGDAEVIRRLDTLIGLSERTLISGPSAAVARRIGR